MLQSHFWAYGYCYQCYSFIFCQKVTLTDESSNSERELQVQIPWQCTLALLGKNMVHSTAHLLHRYGLLSFYWMFTPRGIGSILLKFRSLLPCALVVLLRLFHHFSHLPFSTEHSQTWITSALPFRFGQKGVNMIKVTTFKVSICVRFVLWGTEVAFYGKKKKVQKATLHFCVMFSGFCTVYPSEQGKTAALSMCAHVWYWWSFGNHKHYFFLQLSICGINWRKC